MIHLDFETFSEIDLTEVGAYRYAEDPTTEVLIASFAIDDGPVHRYVPRFDGPKIPQALLDALNDGNHVEAHNAQFERAVWHGVLVKRQGWPKINRTRWRCTAARAAAAGYPRSLEKAALAARLPEKYLKDKRGKDLIRLFCMPRKPTKADQRTRILPEDEPERFNDFCEYCDQDVVTERALGKRLPPLPDSEWAVFHMDMRINEVGMPLDVELLARSASVVKRLEDDLQVRTRSITSFDGDPANGINPTQREKILDWLHSNALTLPNLQIETIQDALSGKNNLNLTPEVREILEIRIEASRASTKKLVSMRACGGLKDGRVRGAYLYGGAHTLRWSSKLVQLHNLVRGLDDPEEIASVLDSFRTGDVEFVRLMYDNPMYMLSQCIRGFISPGRGKELGVVDYAQIEARVLDWHAGNERGIAEWASGIDKYKLMAMRMFGIANIDDVTSEQRRVAKNATLGCGFGMSAKSFLIYCHNNGATDVDQDTADLAVNIYRDSNEPNVVWWSEVENYCKAAIDNPLSEYRLRHCTFGMVKHWLTIGLPSGRRIWYPRARLETVKSKWGGLQEQIVFDGANHKEHTYGAKTVENIVQANSRDILANGLATAIAGGYTVVGHTHDEGITESDEGKTDLPRLIELMCTLPDWAHGIPIKAEGFVTPFYRKD